VTNPKILFLDEPTSGLDSALSLEVCSYIKNIARKYQVRSIRLDGLVKRGQLLIHTPS